MHEDGATDDLVVGLKTTSGEPKLHLSEGTVAQSEKTEKMRKMG